MYHPLTWLVWLVTALLPALTTRNPLHLTILLLTVLGVYTALGTKSPLSRGWATFIRIGLILWGFTIAFDTLTAHYGETPLLHLPDALPLIGGPITLEAFVFGVISGMALVVLVLIFATFNAVVDYYQLLRWVPASLYQAGVVTGIALTFVPQTMASLQEIREAQILRGHRFRGVRDLLPLLVPLLTSGLERAIQLAESMEARGFGYVSRGAEGQGSQGEGAMGRVGLGVALLGACGGLFAYEYFGALRLPALAVVAGSFGLLVIVLRRMGRGVARSRYRHQPWHRRDTTVVVACALVLLSFGAAWATRPEALAYEVYPRVTWPPFEPLVALSLLPLLTPALVSYLQTEGTLTEAG